MKEKMAFAKSGAVDPCGNQLSGEQSGMRLREYYSGQAMQVILASKTPVTPQTITLEELQKVVAKASIGYADALIAELEGGK
jgi:hypothetical protein